MELKACFQSDINDDGQTGSAATGGLMTPETKNLTGIPKNSFLGYNATGHEGLEGASRRLKHPASRYLKIKHLRNFRECFFLAREHRVNTKSNYFI